MKNYNFKSQLKGLNIDQLKELRNKHLDWMLKFAGIDDKSYYRHLNNVSLIDQEIIKSN